VVRIQKTRWKEREVGGECVERTCLTPRNRDAWVIGLTGFPHTLLLPHLALCTPLTAHHPAAVRSSPVVVADHCVSISQAIITEQACR